MNKNNGVWRLVGIALVLCVASCAPLTGISKKDTPPGDPDSPATRRIGDNGRGDLCRIPISAELCSYSGPQRTAEKPAEKSEAACDLADILNGRRHARVPDLLYPVPSGVLSSPFGFRGRIFHSGLDICARKGEPILACADGKVAFAGSRKGYRSYGQAVLVDHGRDVLTHYAHLSKILVRKGEKVKKGQTIGLVGSTGRATSPHLHLEVRVGSQYYNPFVHFAPRERANIQVAKGFNLTPMGPVRARRLSAQR